MDRGPAEQGVQAHARAREDNDFAWLDEPWAKDVVVHELRHSDDATFKQLVRGIRHLANQMGWRQWSAHRAAKVSRALRACERVLGARFQGRAWKEGRWFVYAHVDNEVVLVVEATLAPVRTRADFLKPLDLLVRRPDVVDVAALERELRLRPRRRPTPATTAGES